MDDLDSRLRALARASLERAAADTPVDDDLATVLARSVRRPDAEPELARTWPWPRLAVAATIVLLVAGAVTVLAMRGGGEVAVAPPVTTAAPTESTVPASSEVTTTDAPTIGRASQAVVEPSIVAPGSRVTITPASRVLPRCPGAAEVFVAGDTRVLGWIEPGRSAFVPASAFVDRETNLCETFLSARPSDVTIPLDLALGTYRICIDEDSSASGCGVVVVDEVASSPTTPTASTIPTPSTTGVESTIVPGLTVMGTAEPRSAKPGAAVEITPPGLTLMRCRGDALVYAAIPVAASTPVAYVDRFDGLVEPEQLDICDYDESSDPVTVTIPEELAPGDYVFCIGSAIPLTVPDRQVCAWVTVDGNGSGAGDQLPVGFFERVYVDEPPYFHIRELGPDGSPVGELTDEQVEVLLRREERVSDGGTIRLLEREEPFGRCDNREVTTSGPTVETTPDAKLIGPVRSLAATIDGVVVVGVDVCADGAQWGDPGTRFELRRIDLSDGSVTILFQRDPGEGDTFFDDRDVVYAGGDFIAESVSPDGGYVAVAEPYTTENTRYHVIDAVAGGEPIEFASACDEPRDLAGPPRFVGDGLVVLARECSPVDVETGDLTVELVSLETLQPIWSVDVDHVAIDSYSSTVSLSADSFDGEVWALVSGSAGVEQPVRAAAVTDGVELPLPGGSIVTFTPEELIYSWDPFPDGPG